MDDSSNVRRTPFSTLYEIAEDTVREIVSIVQLVAEKIQQIVAEIWKIYSAGEHDVPRVIPPVHPIANTYLRCKSIDWPSCLDNAAGNIPGADPDDISGIAHERDHLEWVSPLHAAAFGNNVQAVPRLVAEGGEVNALDVRGQSPAYWAAYFGNLTVLTMLTAYGANLHNKDYRGKTCLRAAVKYGREKAVEFLAAQRVNLDERDGRGLTPLHLAAYKGNFCMYRLLILLGADSTLLDPNNKLAEDILWDKYAEVYRDSTFLFRLFRGRTPPPIPFSEQEIGRLAAARRQKIP